MRGSLRERKPGVYELRVFLGPDPLTGAKRYRSKTFRGGKRAAQTALSEMVTAAKAGRLATTDATMGDLLDRWLERAEGDLSSTTLKEYRRLIARRIKPAIGERPVARLRPAELDQLYLALRSDGLSPGSIRQVHAIIRRALRQAEAWELIARNPARNASPPKQQRGELTPPTPAEVQALIAAAAERGVPGLDVLVRVAAATGARRGELCALRWSDVDLDRRVMVVSESMAQGSTVAKDTKTHAARHISLDEDTVAVLADWRDTQAKRATDGETPLVPDPFVFSPRLAGDRPWSPNAVTQHFRRVVAAAGLTGVRLHDLRHFHATRLLDAGVRVRDVSERLGHAKTSTTLDIYAGLVAGRDDEAAEAIRRVLEV